MTLLLLLFFVFVCLFRYLVYVCLFVYFWFVLCGIVKSAMQWFLLYSFVFVKVGEHQTVLITEDAKDQAHFVGHNKYYDQVSVTHYLVSRVGQLSYWSNGSFPYLKDFPPSVYCKR